MNKQTKQLVVGLMSAIVAMFVVTAIIATRYVQLRTKYDILNGEHQSLQAENQAISQDAALLQSQVKLFLDSNLVIINIFQTPLMNLRNSETMAEAYKYCAQINDFMSNTQPYGKIVSDARSIANGVGILKIDDMQIKDDIGTIYGWWWVWHELSVDIELHKDDKEYLTSIKERLQSLGRYNIPSDAFERMMFVPIESITFTSP